MHNLKELRNNLNFFKKKLEDRNVDFNLNDFEKKDNLNRDLISKKENLENEKKSLSKSKDKSNFNKSKEISNKISDLVNKQNTSQIEINKIIFSLPNLAHEDVPVGKDEKSNKKITTKCIIHTNLNLILPSFGEYTGGLNIKEAIYKSFFKRKYKIYILGKKSIYEFPKTSFE